MSDESHFLFAGCVNEQNLWYRRQANPSEMHESFSNSTKVTVWCGVVWCGVVWCNISHRYWPLHREKE